MAAVAVDAQAQLRQLPSFVLSMGAEYNIATGMLTADDAPDRSYEQNTSIVGAGLGFTFPKLFLEGWGLTLGLSYGQLELDATGTGDATVYINGAPTTGTTTHRYHLELPVFLAELMTHHHISERMRLEFGPFSGVGFFPSVVESESIVAPSGASFIDGSPQRSSSTVSAKEGLIIGGGGLRVGYELPFIGGMALMPMLNLRGMVGIDPDGEVVAGAVSGGLGLALLTSGTVVDHGEPVPVGLVDTVRVIDTAGARSSLRAEVDLYSVDSLGRRADTLVIALRRTLRRIEVPLDTRVRFDPTSAALPPMSVTSPDVARTFTEEDLVAVSPSEIRRRSIEVIAARMRDDRTLTAIASGTRRADEPAWFADARARALRSYLQNTWGIDSSRVRLDTKGSARVGDPEVGLVVERRSTAIALAPVVSEWIEQEVETAPVGVNPVIVADVGVQSWRVSVMQGNREIGVVRNTDDDSARGFDIGMALRRLPRDEARRALGAELVVEDSSGSVTVARDRMEVVVDTTNGTSGDPEVFLGEYLVAPEDDRAAKRTIERVVSTLPVDARVTVSAPVASRSGAETIARDLRELALEKGLYLATTVEADRSNETGGLVMIRVSGRVR